VNLATPPSETTVLARNVYVPEASVVNELVIEPPMNEPTPEATTLTATPETAFPLRSVTVTVTGTPEPLAVPVAAAVIVTKRASAAAFSTHIDAAVETAPDVAVNVIAPVPVASTLNAVTPVAPTTKLRDLTGRPDAPTICPPAPAVTVTTAPVAETPADVRAV
jgi:hypothetical protein